VAGVEVGGYWHFGRLKKCGKARLSHCIQRPPRLPAAGVFPTWEKESLRGSGWLKERFLEGGPGNLVTLCSHLLLMVPEAFNKKIGGGSRTGNSGDPLVDGGRLNHRPN